MKNVNLQKGELKLIPWDQRKSPTPFAEMSWLALAQRAIRDQRGNWKLNSLSKFLPYYIRTHAIPPLWSECNTYAIGLPSCFLSCISMFFDRNRKSLTLDWIWNESLQRRIKSKILFENWTFLAFRSQRNFRPSLRINVGYFRGAFFMFCIQHSEI